MNHGSIWRRLSLGLAALLFSLSVHSCGTTGEVQGDITIPIPFGDDIRIIFTINSEGGRDFEIDAGPQRGGECFEVTWYDAAGNELSTTKGSTDQNGIETGPVPQHATRFVGNLVPCPKPDSGKNASSSKMLEPPTGDPIGTNGSRSSSDFGLESEARDFTVFGGPLAPSDAPGDDNFTYAFQVSAVDAAQVELLLDPILQGGIGTPVPSGVEVLRWSTMEATLTGARLITAQPGQYEVWNFVLNGGAFTADLAGNVSHYAIAGWDVVEVSVPVGAFDQGLTAGLSHENRAALSFKTDRMPSVKVLRDGYESTD